MQTPGKSYNCRYVRISAFVVVVGVVACMDLTPPPSTPLLPTATNPIGGSPATPQYPPAPPFPTVSNAAAIYVGPESLYDWISSTHGSSLPSRYVFFRDSTFQLQFSSRNYGLFSYTGRYSRADSIFTFTWDGWSTAGPWGASGTLRGDTLHVRYNIIMMLTDFVDGPYVLAR